MITKPVIISSSGLKNIVLNKYQEADDFTFVFAEEKFQMKSIFAEFISPVVSHLHQTDPTINYINFGEITGMTKDDFNELSKSLITPDTISHLQQISSGSLIEIDEEAAIKLRFLSILLGNDELQQKLNELFPTNYSEENVNTYMKNIECLYGFSQVNETIDFSTCISFIASHFYMVDIDEFLKLSREIQYMIISHSELQIESEDNLFDIISQIIEKKKDADDKIKDVFFLEQIEFISLSEVKFGEFISIFDFNDMSGQLWQNLCRCFFSNPDKTCQRKLKSHLNKNECCIIVGGYDKYNELGEKSNNKNADDSPIISPPVKLSFDPSPFLSYSAYNTHSVLVTNDGLLKGIGNNKDGSISATLQKTVIENFTDFYIKDGNGHQFTAVSSVCCGCGTLYMLSKSSSNERQLVLCDFQIKEGDPVFLDIGNHHPVSLFGGCYHSAAIGSEGEVIFINRNSVYNSFNSKIASVFLPEGEKASSVACCNNSVFVLSLNGRVFKSPIESNRVLKFSIVEELSGLEIVCVSGTHEHCLAVSKDGRVFGCGSNKYGKIGLGERTESVSSFTEISSLVGYEIRAAYAGCGHSLFETKDGKVLSCGDNQFGQLLLSSGPGKNVFSPIETTITSGATFCIAGNGISVVFMGNCQLKNIPNMRIYSYE